MGAALVEQEIIQREEANLKRHFKHARFPYLKILEGYDFSLISSLNKYKVLFLAQGEFIEKRVYHFLQLSSPQCCTKPQWVKEQIQRINNIGYRYIRLK